MNHLALFNGIGGFQLAASWVGWENVAHVEIDQFCNRVVAYHFPNSQCFTDIKQFDGKPFRNTIDIISGGFPCQGFSLAGKRLGTDDNRYLWPEMLRVVQETKPTWICGENVTGIVTMEDKSGIFKDVFPIVESSKVIRYAEIDHYEGIYTRQAKMLIASICEDFEKEGYEIQPIIIPAASVQAPHLRERVWFIASNNNIRNGQKVGFQTGWKVDVDSIKRNGIITNTGSQGYKGSKQYRTHGGEEWEQRKPYSTTSELHKIPHWSNFPTQSPICDRNDGLSDRLAGITFPKWRNESIKALGNSIVPQVAYQIFKAINEFDKLK